MKLKLIVLIITLFSVSCTNTGYTISKVSYEDNIKVLDSIDDIDIELIIKPYRDKIKTLEKTIGFSKESYSIRDGKLESTLGNLIADILYEESNPEFYKITSNNIDFALFNYGGVRGTLNKGEITQHDLFTIMPWKNLATVVKIKGEKVIDLVDYFNNENLAHPSTRLEIEFINNKIKKILINKRKFDKNKSYYVLTSNFLQEGGDKMTFFKDPLELYNLNLNLRDLLIKSIENKKTIESKLDNRIFRSE
ncbi:MAG: 5'-nucleotidase [Flavobacteriaceae bacterium]|nr:5'-nucleotidase C-terminal domain-containing protein [Flavobacteriaceae bacterium]MDG1032038.1 5'-nucleotidase [Flavobacteriaceae bacterium]MDG1344190.1 5'-nucleotidase [Flavobacteriaceae bacterium]MDG2485551.1 5'-nucleotidase [Flavobacteriaceae bacterium]